MSKRTRLLAIIAVVFLICVVGCGAILVMTDASSTTPIRTDEPHLPEPVEEPEPQPSEPTIEELFEELQQAYGELENDHLVAITELESVRERLKQLQEDFKEAQRDWQELAETVDGLEEAITNYQEELASLVVGLERGNGWVSQATAYTLRSSWRDLGFTRTGYDLNGKDITERIIAVDPTVIQLGSQVYIKFPEPYTHLDGWYSAEDTGSAVKGKIVDVFFGERDQAAHDAAMAFGRRYVEIIAVVPPR
jgi:3D (Asp-Asp-Asp) domain-containing protein/polyhydroxyalkanoate synthesis regulator phasin